MSAPKQGQSGTATVLFRGTLGLVPAGTRRVFRTAGVVAPGDTTSLWVDELGNLLSDEQVTDFVPGEPRPLPVRHEVHDLIANGNDCCDTTDAVMALLRGESR